MSTVFKNILAAAEQATNETKESKEKKSSKEPATKTISKRQKLKGRDPEVLVKPEEVKIDHGLLQEALSRVIPLVEQPEANQPDGKRPDNIAVDIHSDPMLGAADQLEINDAMTLVRKGKTIPKGASLAQPLPLAQQAELIALLNPEEKATPVSDPNTPREEEEDLSGFTFKLPAKAKASTKGKATAKTKATPAPTSKPTVKKSVAYEAAKLEHDIENEDEEVAKRIQVVLRYIHNPTFGPYLKEMGFHVTPSALQNKSLEELDRMIAHLRVLTRNKSVGKNFDSALFWTTQVVENIASAKTKYNIKGWTELLKTDEDFRESWELVKLERLNFAAMSPEIRMLQAMAANAGTAYMLNAHAGMQNYALALKEQMANQPADVKVDASLLEKPKDEPENSVKTRPNNVQQDEPAERKPKIPQIAIPVIPL